VEITTSTPLGELTHTDRGFGRIDFTDRYGAKCSIQESSLATESAIWLGVNDAEPKVLASQAARFGVSTNETTGWVPYPIPDDVLLTTRMHLSRETAQQLVEVLQRWLETGSL